MVDLTPVAMQQEYAVLVKMSKNGFESRPHEAHVLDRIIEEIVEMRSIPTRHLSSHAEGGVHVDKIGLKWFQIVQDIQTITVMKCCRHDSNAI
tara:strand:- start:6304 stop:6582 length:279 start_codon:yes stop_codon:yes gene_type:complete